MLSKLHAEAEHSIEVGVSTMGLRARNRDVSRPRFARARSAAAVQRDGTMFDCGGVSARAHAVKPGNDMAATLGDALRDLRHAVKSLAKVPSFTLTAVGTLGLAIGASAAIFTARRHRAARSAAVSRRRPARRARGLCAGHRPRRRKTSRPSSSSSIKAQADLLENVGYVTTSSRTRCEPTSASSASGCRTRRSRCSRRSA